MHQPKVSAGTSILLVTYVGSYLLFSIPSLQRCNTCKGTTIMEGTTVVLFKGTTIVKGKTVVLFKGTTRPAKGATIRTKGTTFVTLGRTNVELIAL
jgi:hypothetical protein